MCSMDIIILLLMVHNISNSVVVETLFLTVDHEEWRNATITEDQLARLLLRLQETNVSLSCTSFNALVSPLIFTCVSSISIGLIVRFLGRRPTFLR